MADSDAVSVVRAGSRPCHLLKSWLPEISSGEKRVALGGSELPAQVGATQAHPVRALCVAPGEWLIVSTDLPGAPIEGLAAVDLTEALAVLEVQGPEARNVLAKGCGLDLHSRSFPAGRCARTRLAHVSVVIECLDKPAHFELIVARSYLAYLEAWLDDAAREFGSAPVTGRACIRAT